MAIANFIGSKVQAGTLLFGSMILLHIFLPNGHDSLIVSNAMLQIFFAVFTTIVGVAVTYDLKLKLKEGVLVIVLYAVTLTVMIVNEAFHFI